MRKSLRGNCDVPGAGAAGAGSRGAAEVLREGGARCCEAGPRGGNWWRGIAGIALAAALAVSAGPAPGKVESVTFKIPPVKIPLEVKGQAVNIVAWAVITVVAKAGGLNVLTLSLSADLSDLQRNMTALLSSQLDKEDRCGDNIEIENARLSPQAPASLAVVQLHYDRRGCLKAFGREQSRHLIGGNAEIQMTLTPAVGENHAELRLVPQVGPIEADGSLGELLRSGALGEMIRDKIRAAILSAIQKGTNLDATLPPAVQGYVTIEKAEFEDAGAGRLRVNLSGRLEITNAQIQELSKQVKERAAAR